MPLDAFDWLADPYVAARRLPGHMRMVSSRSPESPEGFDNTDWSHFARVEDGEAVLLETSGPGVITRLWFTMRLDGFPETSATDEARLHLYVDGAEIELVPGERGATLAVLASGSLPAFPRPWAAGRDLSSDAISLFVPIHFQESVRVTLDDVPARITYYQIDWRELPAEALVRSFDGTLSESQRAALSDATALWVTRDERGIAREDVEVTLAPGESRSLEVSEPAVLRRVGLALTSGEPSALAGALVIDGETVVDGLAARWLFAEAPAMPFESALATPSAIDHPAPVESRAALSARNVGAAPLTVRMELAYDPGPAPAGLGRLHVDCGSQVADRSGGNVALSPIEGARGHYVGQFLIVRGARSGWWFMEGDHEVRVDGEHTLLGTGIEDYFGGAFYYLRGPFALPFAGAAGFDLMGETHLGAPRIDVAQYRHHLVDSINFEERFAFEYEVMTSGTGYDHCLYWYRDEP